MSLALALITILAGVLVGVVSALFGIGGGLVMIPLLRVAFGLEAVGASATSLFAILPTSVSSIVNRRKDGTINVRLGVLIGLAGMVTSPMGAWVATNVPGWIAMTLTAIIMLYNAISMVLKSRNHTQNESSTAPKKRKPSPFFPLVLGVVTGFFSGFLGLGGGFIIVPLLVSFMGLTMHQATGTSLVTVALLSIPGIIAHALLGNVAWLLGAFLVIGSIPGSKLGAYIVQRISNRGLMKLFAVVLTVSAVSLIVREFF